MLVRIEIASSPMLRDGFYLSGCSTALILYLLPNKILCVLATLRDNLFSSSHDLRDCRSLLTVLLLIEEIDFEE